MREQGPFHEGERTVQERAGERSTALRVGAMVGAVVPPGAVPFLAEQRMLALGSADEQGGIAATVVLGARGFVSSRDGSSVVIDRSRADVRDDDPAWSHLRVGTDVGLLAIELASRRRLRINGVVGDLDGRRVEVRVRESYPNCPKYVQRRHLHERPGAPPAEPLPPASGVALDDLRSLAIERADTLFVASRHPTRGIDVSHRGGAPGFVRVLDRNRLRIPDYRGNSMFNTLGNFMVDDRAGLVVLDFERGRLLRMTGRAAVRFGEVEDPRQPTGGTGRYWDFLVAAWHEAPIASGVAWELLDRSPYNPRALV